MHPVILGAVADPEAIEGRRGGRRDHGDGRPGYDVVIPECAGEVRDLEEFVPLATAATLIDEEGAGSGLLRRDGGRREFKIEVLGADSYDLDYEAKVDFGAEKLVWEAEVNPGQAVIETEGGEVNGVAYTVTGVSCAPTS